MMNEVHMLGSGCSPIDPDNIWISTVIEGLLPRNTSNWNCYWSEMDVQITKTCGGTSAMAEHNVCIRWMIVLILVRATSHYHQLGMVENQWQLLPGAPPTSSRAHWPDTRLQTLSKSGSSTNLLLEKVPPSPGRYIGNEDGIGMVLKVYNKLDRLDSSLSGHCYGSRPPRHRSRRPPTSRDGAISRL